MAEARYKVSKTTPSAQVVEVDIYYAKDMKNLGTVVSKLVAKYIIKLDDYHAFAIVGGGLGMSPPSLLIGFSTVRENRVTMVTDMLWENDSTLRSSRLYFGLPRLKE